MELLKQNIHMDRICREGSTQITLEDDMNLPETKPDISSLCMETGSVVIEEIRPGADAVSVRGRLIFSVLYHTQEEGGRLVCAEGKILFEEKIRMEGLASTDTVTVSGDVEDLTVGVINSRKLSVQSVLSLNAAVEEIYDEEIPVGVSCQADGKETVQYRQVPMEISQVAMCKKDVLRVKEELAVPSGFPNISQILWKNVEPGEMAFRLGEEKLYIQGELRVCILYEGEGENTSPQMMENRVPVSAEIACSGCREGMSPDIRYRIGQWDLTPRPDLDGEQRVFGLELTMDFKICVYEERSVSLVTDIYGVTQEISGEKKTVELRQLLRCVTGRTKVADHIKLREGARILQLVCSDAKANVISTQTVEDGILIRGNAAVKVLCITGEDEKPYECVRAHIPFEYTLEIPGMQDGKEAGRIQTNIEQLTVTMLDGEEMDVKAIVSFSTTALCRVNTVVIGEISQYPLDGEKLSALPSMVIHKVKPGDNLWNIGKRYYVPVQSLVELNDLSSQEIKPGQKLLIVKGI